MNARNFGIGAGLGGIGSGLAGMFFGGKNPADDAQKYISQIPGATKGYYEPYINAGTGSLPILQGQYGNLLGDPGGMLNKIGGGYQQSPGFKFALQQALQGAGHAAAAGGMAGSPQHEQQSMEVATGLANQDYNNWIRNALGLYGQGLSGEQGLAGMGMQAGTNYADQIAQSLAQQAAYGYQGAAAQNQALGSSLGNIFGGLGTLAAFL